MSYFIQSIYSALRDQPESCFLEISKEGEFYKFNHSERTDAQRSLDLFKEIFPDFQVPEICLNNKITSLSKANVRIIFVNFAHLLEIKSCAELDSLFLDRSPEFGDFAVDKAKSSGKGFKGLCEKVYLQGLHSISAAFERDSVKAEIREAEFLTSRMADREYQVGSKIYLNVGYSYLVAETVVKGGAYISILRDISNPSKVKVVCRGTAMRPTATGGLKSGLNDLQYEVGNGGVQACWPEISNFITAQNITEAEIYGKSLGGAHAQRLAILFMQQLPGCAVKALTTVGSLGVGDEAEALFSELVAGQGQESCPTLTVIRNGGTAGKGADYIPFAGGVHLGATIDPVHLDTRIYYIDTSAEEILPPDSQISFFRKAKRFATSLPEAHIRQNTFGIFSYRLVEKEQISSELRMGNQLERPRRFIAYKKMTSFTDFVHSRKSYDRIVGKVTMAAGMVFLGLLGGTVACFLVHPGMVVYQGHGLLLTLPTIVMAAGSGASLAATLLGSSLGVLLNQRKRRISGNEESFEQKKLHHVPV